MITLYSSMQAPSLTDKGSLVMQAKGSGRGPLLSAAPHGCCGVDWHTHTHTHRPSCWKIEKWVQAWWLNSPPDQGVSWMTASQLHQTVAGARGSPRALAIKSPPWQAKLLSNTCIQPWSGTETGTGRRRCCGCTGPVCLKPLFSFPSVLAKSPGLKPLHDHLDSSCYALFNTIQTLKLSMGLRKKEKKKKELCCKKCGRCW